MGLTAVHRSTRALALCKCLLELVTVAQLAEATSVRSLASSPVVWVKPEVFSHGQLVQVSPAKALHLAAFTIDSFRPCVALSSCLPNTFGGVS